MILQVLQKIKIAFRKKKFYCLNFFSFVNRTKYRKKQNKNIIDFLGDCKTNSVLFCWFLWPIGKFQHLMNYSERKYSQKNSNDKKEWIAKRTNDNVDQNETEISCFIFTSFLSLCDFKVKKRTLMKYINNIQIICIVEHKSIMSSYYNSFLSSLVI